MLLEQQADIELVGSVETLAAARELMEADGAPDVLILDVRLASERGLELLTQSSDQRPRRPAVVIWTGFDLPQCASFALRAAAAGFVVKTAPHDELVTAIRTAAAGGLRFTRTADVEPRDLSHRERAILGHVIAGRRNDEIAWLDLPHESTGVADRPGT